MLFKSGQIPEGDYPFESLRLWLWCRSREWCHLPIAGGFYDQHPDLIRQWQIIDEANAEVEDWKQAQKQLKGSSKGPR